MKNPLVIVTVIVICIIACYFFVFTPNFVTIGKYNKQKSLIDSLSVENSFLQKEELKLDSAIDKYKKHTAVLDARIDSTKNQIKYLNAYYSSKIKVVSSYNAAQLDSFFTNRYK